MGSLHVPDLGLCAAAPCHHGVQKLLRIYCTAAAVLLLRKSLCTLRSDLSALARGDASLSTHMGTEMATAGALKFQKNQKSTGMKSRATLGDLPGDSVTKLCFSPSSALFAVSSWDCGIHLYGIPDDYKQASRRTVFGSHTKPVFALDWSDDGALVSGSADCTVVRTDVASGACSLVGRHAAPVKEVRVLDSSRNIVVSGSWDSQVIAWDLRLARPIDHTAQGSKIDTVPAPQAVCRIASGGKVFAMDSAGNRILLGLSSRTVQLWDFDVVHSEFKQVLIRESPLRHQTRSVALCASAPDGQGKKGEAPSHDRICLGSIEGRVAVDTLQGKSRFAFRCHRKPDADNVLVSYPVNVVRWCPKGNVLFTGGSDGDMYVWSLETRKRLFRLCEGQSISALDIAAGRDLLGLATSYMWERGTLGPAGGASPSACGIFLYSLSEFLPPSPLLQQ